MRVERRLSVTPEAAAEARHALTVLAGEIPDGRMRDVRLLVSELVTNAVRHANLDHDDVIDLVVELSGHRLRVEVHDPGGGFLPSAPSPDPARPSGWGLYLVDELADRWGVDSDDKTLVWFELDRRAAAA
ncbi:MAG TPA: ATP-binding protein [Thermoleophilaceae bacterium]|nr:ATP-binding protein [Thermoleophilaceae bacterium]